MKYFWKSQKNLFAKILITSISTKKNHSIQNSLLLYKIAEI